MADSLYPESLRGWTTKRDFQDPIWAHHFHQVQDEIFAIQTIVGINPQIATADPAHRTPDYGTVANRVTKSARGEPMCSYRGSHIGASIVPNEYFRPRLEVMEDTHGAAISTGYVIPQTGYWLITAKADWLSTPQTAVRNTTRMIGIEVNTKDIGLRDVIVEDDYNRAHLTTVVNWQEALPEGTILTVALSTIVADVTKTIAPANVYFRAHLIRCLGKATGGLPTLDFLPEPEPPKPPVVDDGCQMHNPVQTQPPAVQPRVLHLYRERFDGGENTFYNDGSFAGIFYHPTLGTNGPDSRG